jgi:hypothetical protein
MIDIRKDEQKYNKTQAVLQTITAESSHLVKAII